jgi:hypothetical protein
MATTIKRSVMGGAVTLPGRLWTLPGVVVLPGELAELELEALAVTFEFEFEFEVEVEVEFAFAFLFSQSAMGSLLWVRSAIQLSKGSTGVLGYKSNTKRCW